MQIVDKHAMPKLADLPVDQISKQEIGDVLSPIWTTTPETADRLHKRIRNILDYCKSHDYVQQNVADEGIYGALPKRKRNGKTILRLTTPKRPMRSSSLKPRLRPLRLDCAFSSFY